MNDESPPHALPSPPQAEPRSAPQAAHGYRWNDEFAWLRSQRWREAMRDGSALEPDIRAYLEAENDYCTRSLEGLADLRKELFEEYRGRIVEDDASVPQDEGPWSYYQRYEVGGQHPIFGRRPRGGGEETVLFDGDAEAKGKAFFQVGACEPSPDHRLVAIAEDTSGAELWTLRFREVETGLWLDDSIQGTSGSFEFLDDRTVIYTVLDAEHRPRTVKRHVLGEPPENDSTLYFEEDPGFFVGLSRTESQRFVTIDAHDHDTSEVWLLDAESPSAAPVRVATRTVGVEYDVSHHGESLIMRTNAGGAEDYTLASMPLSALGADEARNSWRELLPPQAGRLRLGYHLFRNHLVVIERVDGLPQLVIYDLSDAQLTRERKVSFSEEVYSLGLVGAREFDTQVFRFVYSSMTTPQRTYDYDMSSGERVLRKEQILPSGHDPARYVAKRLMISASDGEEVPVSILHRADVPLDGSAPCLLYGYGAYGHAMPAGFSLTRLSLVDRGVIFAIAHVRGGMDRGYRWYRDGKLQKKRNTFSDFAAAARALGDRRLVDASRIAAMGGSAGGMLMGVLANEHSELFSAIVADVPFVDVLNTMLDETLPLTPPEWPEWGDPIRDASAFEYIRGYSPYDNVREGPYPHLLVLAGLSDPRVTYWEPAKWVARLRARKTDDRLLLLKTNMEAGHGGAAGRFEALEEVAFEQSFLLHVLGAM